MVFIIVCVYACHDVRVEVEGQLRRTGSLLSPFVGSEIKLRLTGLCGMCLCPLSHLAGPRSGVYITQCWDPEHM